MITAIMVAVIVITVVTVKIITSMFKARVIPKAVGLFSTPPAVAHRVATIID